MEVTTGRVKDEAVNLQPRLQRRTFRPGELLWGEGDEAALYVLVHSGHVNVYRTLADGSTTTLYLFGPGDVFGFMPFLDGEPYPASARALTAVEARVMTRSEFVAALARDSSMAFAILGVLSARLRDAFVRIERASRPKVVPTVADALVSLLPRAASSGLAVIELPVRSRQLARALGVAPESFSRAVTKLVQARILHRIAPRRFQVLDDAGLRRAARRPGDQRARHTS